MVIFRDPVTPLQALGYGIALAGLVYYRLGAEGISSMMAGLRQSMRNVGPRRLVLLIAVLGVAYLIFQQYSQNATVLSSTLLKGVGSKI